MKAGLGPATKYGRWATSIALRDSRARMIYKIAVAPPNAVITISPTVEAGRLGFSGAVFRGSASPWGFTGLLRASFIDCRSASALRLFSRFFRYLPRVTVLV